MADPSPPLSSFREKTAAKLVTPQIGELISQSIAKLSLTEPSTKYRLGASGNDRQERLKLARKNLEDAISAFDERAKQALRDNARESETQRLLAAGLFIAGIAVILVGAYQKQLPTTATGFVPEILIVWPYSQLKKIKDENTFLTEAGPWAKMHLAKCDTEADIEDVARCYRKVAEIFDDWMKQLNKSAFGDSKAESGSS